MNKSPNINYFWADMMIEELTRLGIDTFCVSPGSRSSALTMAVANNKKARPLIHFDERGSAFRALGHVSATGNPAVIITTSGTAAANLFPAIIEASKKKVPLIVLTADRPPELRFTGAHQTIDQNKIYGDYVRWFFDMPCPTQSIAPEFVLTTIDQAVSLAKGNPGGPVHINCMYREPLAPKKANFNAPEYTRSVRAWQRGDKAFTEYIPSEPQIKQEALSSIAEKMGRIRNGLIVVGKLKNNEERQSVLSLAGKLHWPVFADVTSGLRYGNDHPHIIHYYDQLLLSGRVRSNLKIDGIVHLGGRVTSKRWYQFVQAAKPSQYIMVLNHPLRNDPLHTVTTRIQCPVQNFCTAVTKKIDQRKPSNFLEQLQKSSKKADDALETYFSGRDKICEPHVARMITECAPQDSILFMASSMPVRDCDMYGTFRGHPVHLGSNRGASGIDGTIATAVGYCEALKKPATLLIGDLAFLYDLNSLSMVRELEQPFVIVVLNNNGGGIFSFLPIHEQNDKFERYFGTPHHLDFHGAGDLFGINYAQIESPGEFIKTYGLALQSESATIIEIKTDRTDNLKTHQELDALIRKTFDEKSRPKARNNNAKKHSPVRQTDLLDQLGELRRHQVR